MKVVILAGGLGTRLSEKTDSIPKPMVEIGGRPMLWHIMKIYDAYRFKEFVVALGYKGDIIKDYFLKFRDRSSHLTVNLSTGEIDRHAQASEDWTVHLIDTGIATNTGGRVRRLRDWLGNEPFMLTYGDGVADVDIDGLIECHRRNSATVTLTAVRPPARFGGLVLDGPKVAQFVEKPQIGEGWINGGFMVCEPDVFDYLDEDSDSFEAHALERIAAAGKLAAYHHGDFWQCMDTLRDVRTLEQLWELGDPPWIRSPGAPRRRSDGSAAAGA